MKICGQCGILYADSLECCPKCGVPVEAEKGRPARPGEVRRQWLLLVLLIPALILALYGLGFWLSGN